MYEIEVTLTFTTPVNIGSGAQVGTLADRAFIKDREGWPYIPATALKGRLRHAVEQIAQGLGVPVCETHHRMCRDAEEACPACRIFGAPWIPGSLRFTDLGLCGPDSLVAAKRRDRFPRTKSRYGVALSRRRGVAEDAHLYRTELFRPGMALSFGGRLSGAQAASDAAWVVAGLRAMSALGSGKTGGLGHLQVEANVTQDGETVAESDLRQALQREVGA
jgi:CRISPR/Cas system CSM-associated protein Csm3 (group 7 of RAMP superfamily)